MSKIFKECGSVDLGNLPSVNTPEVNSTNNYPTTEDQEFALLQKRLELQQSNVKKQSDGILDNNS